MKAAGAFPPPSRTRTGPASAPALGLRAGGDGLVIVSQTARSTEFIPFYKETPTMWLISLFRSPIQSRKRARVGRIANPSCRKCSFVPRLEILEDRTLLSTLTVLNNLDSGAGSLRDTITKAKDGDTIVFAASVNGQTITLTSDS
jgi:hypothetical protein